MKEGAVIKLNIGNNEFVIIKWWTFIFKSC